MILIGWWQRSLGERSLARTLWDLVYERGHDLPPAIADTPSWLRSG
ncbi:hypothetical protein SAMN05216338_103547 [Bradyrhizobium sp. Rc2d]|nr:hypothetical protein SAMN05216338_103547 [Bradyrhizobium sp. Rc2d]